MKRYSAKKRVTIRQIGGDDGYCWCVLIDGRVKWNGMQRREAAWRRDNEIADLEKQEALTAELDALRKASGG